MNLRKLIIALAAVVATTSHGLAFEPIQKSPSRWSGWPDCVGKVCCDDYQPKPMPCTTGVNCFECPDYCPKPLPCPLPVKAFCCDDFCPKRLPPVCCTTTKNLRCVPSRLPPTDMTLPKKVVARTGGS
ncbi:MAG: hypothetical protein QGG71_17475 [Pirellulaceae bacterium]|jgi:hypothetical protein|nr:hypothetical protein [Pirellulaceae bacterium]